MSWQRRENVANFFKYENIRKFKYGNIRKYGNVRKLKYENLRKYGNIRWWYDNIRTGYVVGT